MRRTALIVMVAVAALLVATAVPAGAAPAEKDVYLIAECDFQPMDPGVWTFTGKDDKVLHIRGAMNQYSEWVLMGGEWTLIGTNTTQPNGNVDPVTFEGPFWGSFSINDTTDGFGDFEGTWAWGNSSLGRASGREVGGDRLLKATLGLDPAGVTGLPEVFPGNGECLLAEYTIIDPS